MKSDYFDNSDKLAIDAWQVPLNCGRFLLLLLKYLAGSTQN